MVQRPPKQYPNQYSGNVVLGGTSTGVGVAFGFAATHIRIENLGTSVAYYNLSSTVASTGDMPLEAGAVFSERVPWASGLGLASASSSTDDFGKRVDVLALGG